MNLRESLHAAVADPPPTRIDLDELSRKERRQRVTQRWTLVGAGVAVVAVTVLIVPLLWPGAPQLPGGAAVEENTTSQRLNAVLAQLDPAFGVPAGTKFIVYDQHSRGDKMKAYYYQEVEASIYLKSDVTPEQRSALAGRLQSDPLVEEVIYESKEQAYENMKQMFSDHKDMVDSVGPAEMPESFRVSLKDPTQFAAFNDSYKESEGVQSIVDQQQLQPQLPDDWYSASVEWTVGDTKISISVHKKLPVPQEDQCVKFGPQKACERRGEADGSVSYTAEDRGGPAPVLQAENYRRDTTAVTVTATGVGGVPNFTTDQLLAVAKLSGWSL